jgi:hypothetical protein
VLVPIPSKYLGGNGNVSEKEVAEDVVLQDVDNGNASEIEDAADGDGSDIADSEFCASDRDAEDGDDNLFLGNVDKGVNEDAAGLEHQARGSIGFFPNGLNRMLSNWPQDQRDQVQGHVLADPFPLEK